jgi:protein OS-9
MNSHGTLTNEFSNLADTILFVKEIATCQYILVIYTPRLCGEPGFKSERDTQEETFLRCREVVDDDTPVPRASLSEPESDEGDEYPRKRRVKPVVNAVQKVSEKVAQKEDPASMIKLALQALMKDSSFGNGEPVEMAHIAVESGDEVYLVDLDVNDLGGDEVSLEEKIRKAIEKEQEGKEQRKKGTKHQVAHDEL